MVDADPQGDLTTALGWTDADNLPITLETQMKKILQDEPFVYNEGILHHEEADENYAIYTTIGRAEGQADGLAHIPGKL